VVIKNMHINTVARALWIPPQTIFRFNGVIIWNITMSYFLAVTILTYFKLNNFMLALIKALIINCCLIINAVVLATDSIFIKREFNLNLSALVNRQMTQANSWRD